MAKDRRYVCTTCDRVCESNHATLVHEETVVTRRGDERKVTVKGTGLGTWHCAVHGATKVRVVRVVREE